MHGIMMDNPSSPSICKALDTHSSTTALTLLVLQTPVVLDYLISSEVNPNQNLLHTMYNELCQDKRNAVHNRINLVRQPTSTTDKLYTNLNPEYCSMFFAQPMSMSFNSTLNTVHCLSAQTPLAYAKPSFLPFYTLKGELCTFSRAAGHN